MLFGMGSWRWFGSPYGYSYRSPGYSYGWRCRWFPWLPRWWWTGIYGPMSPYTMPKDQEMTLLQDEVRLLEQTLANVNKRLEELKKKEE
jgi:hypothetical protein